MLPILPAAPKIGLINEDSLIADFPILRSDEAPKKETPSEPSQMDSVEAIVGHIGRMEHRQLIALKKNENWTNSIHNNFEGKQSGAEWDGHNISEGATPPIDTNIHIANECKALRHTCAALRSIQACIAPQRSHSPGQNELIREDIWYGWHRTAVLNFACTNSEPFRWASGNSKPMFKNYFLSSRSVATNDWSNCLPVFVPLVLRIRIQLSLLEEKGAVSRWTPLEKRNRWQTCKMDYAIRVFGKGTVVVFRLEKRWIEWINQLNQSVESIIELYEEPIW